VAIDHSEDVGEQVGEHVEEAARKARPWMDRIARTGYVAKGTVYATVGILAGQVAPGSAAGPPARAAPSTASARSPLAGRCSSS